MYKILYIYLKLLSNDLVDRILRENFRQRKFVTRGFISNVCYLQFRFCFTWQNHRNSGIDKHVNKQQEIS